MPPKRHVFDVQETAAAKWKRLCPNRPPPASLAIPHVSDTSNVQAMAPTRGSKRTYHLAARYWQDDRDRDLAMLPIKGRGLETVTSRSCPTKAGSPRLHIFGPSLCGLRGRRNYDYECDQATLPVALGTVAALGSGYNQDSKVEMFRAPLRLWDRCKITIPRSKCFRPPGGFGIGI